MLELREDFLAVGFKCFVKMRDRNYRIKTQYSEYKFRSKIAELGLHTLSLSKLFIALGMPTGKKTVNDFKVPKWIREAPKFIKRLFLAGFFGAEMSSPSTLSKTGFYSPIISQNKNEKYVESCRKFFAQIIEMLDDFDVKAKKISVRKEHVNKFGDTYRIRLLISSDENNLLRLWGGIGFEYNNARKRLANIAMVYILEKKKLTKQRIEIAEKVKEYKKIGLKARETKGLLISDISNERFIERCLWGNVKSKQRITLDFISFDEFVLKREKELDSYGALFDGIDEIDDLNEAVEVYDLSLRDNHNFIANNIIVSNCGVRLILTNLSEADVKPKIRELMDKLFRNVPSGVGSKGKLSLSTRELDEAVKGGANWAVEKGYGWKEDAERVEENGAMKAADPSKVSQKAKSRGAPQFGTLGAGNHFLEVQKVDKIIDANTAKTFGIENEGQAVVMLHCGSRGFGHQVCDDYIRVMLNASKKYNIKLPDPELCCAPINSQEAKDYIGAMYSAVNYAFCNRQVMTHWIRETFSDVFGKSADMLNMHIVYDVCHNIAKFEEHEINGKMEEVCVHRKGATRAFPADRKEIPQIYRNVGQPVLIPGSMGTASYVLVGTEGGKECFYSTCHGSGRVMSRHAAIRSWKGEKIKEELEAKGIHVRATEWELIAEEAPGAYKNVDDVVRSVELAGISKIVARLVPLGVAKG
jgi:tRNA-splicing ligase RtcB